MKNYNFSVKIYQKPNLLYILDHRYRILLIGSSGSGKTNVLLNQIEFRNLYRQTGKISALLSGNFSKYEFLTGKNILPKKDLLEKADTIKIFEYFPLGKAFKKHTNVINKQTEVVNRKEDKRNKLLKIIIKTVEKIWG